MINPQRLCLRLCGLVLAASQLCACTDEIVSPKSTDDIRFLVTVGDENSRSDDNTTPILAYEVSPMRCSSGKKAYLHAQVTPWTDQPTYNTHDSRARAGAPAIVTSADNMHGRFTVSAFHYNDAWTTSMMSAVPNYFHRAVAQRTESGYALTPPKFWPKGGKMRFVAFAPDNAPGIAYPEWGTEPGYHYTVPDDPADHTDVMMAVTEGIASTGSNTQIPLHFKHALTAVRFKLADDMPHCKITRVSIRNVYRVGLIIPRSFAAENAKTSPAAMPGNTVNIHCYDAKYTFNKDMHLEVPGNVEQYVVDDSGNPLTFMMIPQHFGSEREAEVAIEFKQIDETTGAESSSTECLYGYITNTEWTPGTMITYRVSYKEWWQGLDTTPIATLSYTGGDRPFTVTSFDISYGDHNTKSVKWEASFREPGASTFSTTPPSWISVAETSTYPLRGDNKDSYTLRIAPTPSKYPTGLDLNADLSVGTPQAQTKPYNLAGDTTGMNRSRVLAPKITVNGSNPYGLQSDIYETANCYVTDRAGWFLLPAVYGNGIKNFSTNEESFHPAVNAAFCLDYFVAHDGKNITSPFIKDHFTAANGYDAAAWSTATAGMLWSDAQNMISNVSFVPNAYSGKGGILFYIDPAKIKQANSVIQLKVGGNVVWSWHIWTTPIFYYRPTVQMQNHHGIRFDYMGTNLGWVSLERYYEYPLRTCTMRIQATNELGHTKTIYRQIVQRESVKYWHGFSTFYQWGRKDAFPGGRVDWNTIPWYNENGWDLYNTNPVGFDMGKDKTAIANRISHPINWHTVPPSEEYTELNDQGEWERVARLDLYYNLWDSKNTTVWTGTGQDTADDPPIDRGTVKSIYDPCPVGYKIPTLTAYTGLTISGKNRGIDLTNKDWLGEIATHNYTHATGESMTNVAVFSIFADAQMIASAAIPSTGYRNWIRDAGFNTATITEVCTDAYYWTSKPHDRHRAYYACLSWGRTSYNHIHTMSHYMQLDGFCVRPVLDHDYYNEHWGLH